MKQRARLVEVGPRDGFQSVAVPIPTTTKIGIVRALYEAGIRRMELTSFVSPKAVPQLSDAQAVLEAAALLPGLDAQVLVPNVKQARRALEAGARHLSFVVSASARHNLENVRRLPQESVQEFESVIALLPGDSNLRLNIATAFDCPFEGCMDPEVTLDLLGRMVDAFPNLEVALCDTTGRAGPNAVGRLFAKALARFPQVQAWAFHGHDTYGMGVANVVAAWNEGIRIIDSSISGLGGCPFAPGAAGNVATEDLVYLFEKMDVQTGIDLVKLLQVAHQVAQLESASVGGRVRDAYAGLAIRGDVEVEVA
jgi:hydroxymethylglutaryl-CoA lyase